MSNTRAPRPRLLLLFGATLLAALLAVAAPGPTSAGGRLDEAPAVTTATAPAFPHALHREAEVECATCHLGEDGKSPLRPTAATCLECHGEGEVTMPVATAPSHAREWTFPHETHVAAVGDCTACHDAALPTPTAQLSMAACLDCHGDGVELGCRACHTRVDENVAPGPGSSPLIDHSQAWTLRHGENSKLAEQTCAYCHQLPSDCQSCHRDTPPRSHTRQFKVETHGVEAELDRQRCQSCHSDASFCSDCHQEVPPRSHTPAWGKLGGQHCGSCHLPLADTSCALCHSSLEAHKTEAPADHRAGWGQPANSHCGSCHLPLADTSCAVCHASLDAHQAQAPANDHTAGWGEPADNHCGSCHQPLADTACATCHQATPSHDRAPSSHVANWGQPANGHCGSCHLPLADTDCATCHQDLAAHRQEAPSDTHRGGWGQPANNHCGSCHLPLADTSCATCHQESDLAVHQEAPPPATHDVTWGGRLNNHCGSCHLPLADTECFVCHRDLTAHDTPPPSHDSGFNRAPTFGHCNGCHFPVREEESCAVCHRRDEHRSSPGLPDNHDTISDCLYCHPSSEPTNHPLTDMETCLRCHSPG